MASIIAKVGPGHGVPLACAVSCGLFALHRLSPHRQFSKSYLPPNVEFDAIRRFWIG